jgi:hypothetical protein
MEPLKTVQAVPVIPGRIWLRGKKPGLVGGPEVGLGVVLGD